MLTDKECRNATCPDGKTRIRLSDGGSLYLEIAPNGSKRWFWKYLFGGKEKRLALGSYPAVMPARVRLDRDAARLLLKTGADPAQQRRAERLVRSVSSATTFEAVAREFHKKQCPTWSAVHAAQWLRCAEKDLFPWLGLLPLDSITAPMLLEPLRRVQARGAKRLAHDLREFAGQVFRYGIQTGRCERDPAADLRGALEPYIEQHMAAVLEPGKVGELMRAIDAYTGQPATRAALQLSALLFQRPGNVRAMAWPELDLEAGLWSIPSGKVKRTKAEKVNGRPHLVPLAPQAVAILRDDMQPLTGHGHFVFPSLLTGERCMSENTVRGALRRLGYDNDTMTPHGFRAMARTILVEQLGVAPDVVEAQLAHAKRGPLGSAYDRAEFVAQRRQMMQAWADYLDELRKGAKVLPFKAA